LSVVSVTKRFYSIDTRLFFRLRPRPEKKNGTITTDLTNDRNEVQLILKLHLLTSILAQHDLTLKFVIR
jgi:hypothetical protein